MVRNLLAIVQAASLELGIPSPVSVVGSTDQQAGQLLALANQEGEELAQVEGGWERLRGEQLITLVPGQDTYAFPNDFAYYVKDAMWNRTTHYPVTGPMSASDWQFIKSGLFPSGVYSRFRIFSGSIVFDPKPTAAGTVAIEYISSNWCISANNVTQSQFLSDNDTPLLPDRLFILGIKWRYRAAKGLNYSEERAAYDLAISRLHPRDFVTENINISARHGGYGYLNNGLLPLGNWPGR